MIEPMTGVLLVVIVLAVSVVYAFMWYRHEPHREQLKHWFSAHPMRSWLRRKH